MLAQRKTIAIPSERNDRLDTLEHGMELLRNALQPQPTLTPSNAHTFTQTNGPYELWSPPGPDGPLVVDGLGGLAHGLGLWSTGHGNIDSSGAVSDGNSSIVYGSNTENIAARTA